MAMRKDFDRHGEAIEDAEILIESAPGRAKAKRIKISRIRSTETVEDEDSDANGFSQMMNTLTGTGIAAGTEDDSVAYWEGQEEFPSSE